MIRLIRQPFCFAEEEWEIKEKKSLIFKVKKIKIFIFSIILNVTSILEI